MFRFPISKPNLPYLMGKSELKRLLNCCSMSFPLESALSVLKICYYPDVPGILNLIYPQRDEICY